MCLSEVCNRTDWEQMKAEVFALILRLQQQPKKIGYAFHPGGILNAYREGDLTFDQAVKTLEEWKKFISPGTPVKTTEENLNLRGEWTQEALLGRKWGLKGVVVTHHDSHGLCYEVRHEDGSVGCYDPSELEVI